MKIYYQKKKEGIYHVSLRIPIAERRARGQYVSKYKEINSKQEFINFFKAVKAETWKCRDGVIRFGKVKVLNDNENWKILMSVEQAELFWQEKSAKVI